MTLYRQLLPVRDSSFDARTMAENFRRLAALLGLDGRQAGLDVFATLIGGQAFSEVALVASTSTSADDDVEVLHGLGRVPEMVVLGPSTDTVGRAVGVALGASGAAGGNVTPWTETAVYLRATVTGTYSVVIL